jgi:hypothetical protein
MPILRRANDEQASEFEPIPVGVWRFVLLKPELQYSERFGNWQAKFTLTLPDDEKERLFDDHGKPPEGIQQSTIVSYWTGLSLGYMGRDSVYKSTKLIDFLSACLGSSNQKRFRDWIINGGGPPRAEDPDDPEQELDQIREWLGWWENLEVYGSIRHDEDKNQKGVMWARFGGPMPVGSMPGEKNPDYQALALGKLRSMIAEGEAAIPDTAAKVRQEVARARAATRVGVKEEDDVPF